MKTILLKVFMAVGFISLLTPCAVQAASVRTMVRDPKVIIVGAIAVGTLLYGTLRLARYANGIRIQAAKEVTVGTVLKPNLCKISITDTMTVAQVKAAIFASQGIPVEEQMLRIDNVELVDTRSIKTAMLTERTTHIMLVVGVRRAAH